MAAMKDPKKMAYLRAIMTGRLCLIASVVDHLFGWNIKLVCSHLTGIRGRHERQNFFSKVVICSCGP